MMIAKGEFEVDLQPVETAVSGKNGIQMRRLSISKSFEGDLDATSQGEMLSVMTTTEGSAGYVAVEQVEGALAGRQGAFVLQHYGIANQGDQRLVLEVVPDSGSGELRGLSGKMTIRIEDGSHQYELEYQLNA